MANRTTSARADDALARLQSEANIWVATASPDGKNAVATGQARAALDSADEVAIFDTDVEVLDFDKADATLIAAYIQRVGWDPRDNPGSWALLILTPRRAQAWNGPSEISGRTIIRDGDWLTD